MDTLHDVMRAISAEHKASDQPRRDHLTVFREFLDHLDRVSRRRTGARAAKSSKPKSSRRR